MTATISLAGALLVDFTGSASGFKSFDRFGDDFVQLIRSQGKGRCVVVVDRAVGGALPGPAVVRDHLNFTGYSPLCGPNDPCGERFPVVQGIYVENALPNLPRVVAAGLKDGVKVSSEDLDVIKELGGEVGCYNLVPAMLVAAHAKCQMLAILVQDGVSAELAAELKKLAGEEA